MWVFEEMVNGRKLTEIINETHCNEKYLPDFTIPDNVVGVVSCHSVLNIKEGYQSILCTISSIRHV